VKLIGVSTDWGEQRMTRRVERDNGADDELKF